MHSEGILTSPCTYEAGFISRWSEQHKGEFARSDTGGYALSTVCFLLRLPICLYFLNHCFSPYSGIASCSYPFIIHSFSDHFLSISYVPSPGPHTIQIRQTSIYSTFKMGVGWDG